MSVAGSRTRRPRTRIQLQLRVRRFSGPSSIYVLIRVASGPSPAASRGDRTDLNVSTLIALMVDFVEAGNDCNGCLLLLR